MVDLQIDFVQTSSVPTGGPTVEMRRETPSGGFRLGIVIHGMRCHGQGKDPNPKAVMAQRGLKQSNVLELWLGGSGQDGDCRAAVDRHRDTR